MRRGAGGWCHFDIIIVIVIDVIDVIVVIAPVGIGTVVVRRLDAGAAAVLLHRGFARATWTAATERRSRLLEVGVTWTPLVTT